MNHDSTEYALFSHARDGIDAATPYAVTAHLTFSDDSSSAEGSTAGR